MSGERSRRDSRGRPRPIPGEAQVRITTKLEKFDDRDALNANRPAEVDERVREVAADPETRRAYPPPESREDE